MKTGDWKNIAELLGIAAIVASLIFVGLQLKQSQEIAIASQYQARADATMAFFNAHIEAGYVIRPLRDQVSDTLSAEDLSAALWYWYAFDNHHFQNQSGFLSEGAWHGQLRSMQEFYNICAARVVYESRKISFRPELVALVESWEDKC